MNNIIETDSLSQFGFVERNLVVYEDFIPFLDKIYYALKKGHTDQGYFSGMDEFNKPAEYCPCVHAKFYNLFFYKSDYVYFLYKNIQEMVIEYSEKNNIDYKKEAYHIHGFFSYTKKEQVKESWHDHGAGENHLHGFIPIDAEPSHTLYKIDDKDISLIAKNGRIVVGKNTMHSRAEDWNEDRRRISVAFNIKPYKTMPDNEFYIPLI